MGFFVFLPIIISICLQDVAKIRIKICVNLENFILEPFNSVVNAEM